MESNVTTADYVEFRQERANPKNEAHSSGVSWGAVFGGAFVAAAFYLILLALGAGLGLSAVSPWSNIGASASTVGSAAIIWLILMQIIASALGGYLTGRLRTRWALIHTDEVYFRDTANGFLAWAVALVISVTFLASAAASMVVPTFSTAVFALSSAELTLGTVCCRTSARIAVHGCSSALPDGDPGVRLARAAGPRAGVQGR